MRGKWFSRRVHPEGLEPSTNVLRDHCYDVLTPNNIGLTVSSLEVCPRFLCPNFRIWVFLVLFTNDGKSESTMYVGFLNGSTSNY